MFLLVQQMHIAFFFSFFFRSDVLFMMILNFRSSAADNNFLGKTWIIP